jgi:hypothetical protein
MIYDQQESIAARDRLQNCANCNKNFVGHQVESSARATELAGVRS